jgi:PAS domain S-box-containing protein
MDYSDRTREELLEELLHLQHSNNALRKQYEADIDLITLAESKAGRSEEKFRKVYMTSPDSVNINRLSDGMFVSVNEGFTKILGYSEEETIGKSSFELNIWADVEVRKRLVLELTRNGKVENFEAIFIRKDGSIVNGLMSASLINIDGVPHILNVTKDITARKKIEETLAHEQFLMNAIMKNIPDHVYFKDKKSRFMRVSESMALMFGLKDPSELVGKTDFDFFSDEHARQAFNDEQEIIRTGQILSKEEKETHIDGPDTWVSTVKMPLHDHRHNIIGTFGISRDITNRKESDDQLFLLANALKSINEAVSITDMNDKVLFLNKAFLDTYGFRENELTEETISSIRSPNNPPDLVQEILPATIKGGWHGELLNCKKDGSEFLISLSTAVIKEANGAPVALIGVASDITTRKRIELENQVNHEIIKGITTTSNLDELLKLIHASLRRIVYAENFFVALYNQESGFFSFPYYVDKYDPMPLPAAMEKSCTNYVFRNVRPLVLTQDIFEQLVARGEVELIGSNSPSWIGIPLQTPTKVIGVMVLQHYERENIYTENDVKFLVAIGGQIALSIERKKAEEEILLKNEMLLAINAEKDKFFSIMAHDLKGPMSAFVSATEILTEDIQNMTLDEIREIMISMRTDASNLYKLLENLLEWSRLKRGVIEYNLEKLNLKSIVNSCIEALNSSALKKKININVTIPQEISITADRHMIETVVRNFVSNAIKFTPAGGLIFISASVSGDKTVEVIIRDTGIGMKPDLLNRLFFINEKTSRQGTDGEPSTGLGLMLCKEFIEKHGGLIRVESEEGKGSTFIFTLKNDA